MNKKAVYNNIEELKSDISVAQKLYQLTPIGQGCSSTETITAYLIEKGYGNVKMAIKQFADALKKAIERYRLDNEYFNENEPNSNLWQMNSSIFYIEVIEKGGLIDEVTKEFLKNV